MRVLPSQTIRRIARQQRFETHNQKGISALRDPAKGLSTPGKWQKLVRKVARIAHKRP
jgi:hypothetical protein